MIDEDTQPVNKSKKGNRILDDDEIADDVVKAGKHLWKGKFIKKHRKIIDRKINIQLFY